MTSPRLFAAAAAAVLCCAALTSAAQEAALTPPAGSVSGTILASDTQRPMRFAQVTLAPVSPPEPKLPSAAEQNSLKDDPAAAMKMIGSLMSSMTVLSAQTGLDGKYTIEGVAPGDYYISALAPGYISPVLRAMESAPSGAKGKAALAGIPVVHVEANHSTRGDQTLERGAAISGTVTYDDGSPAAGVKVLAQQDKADDESGKKAEDKDLDPASELALMPLMMSIAAAQAVSGITDDRGRFRLAGIAPGDYRVVATVAANGGFSMRGGQIDLAAAMHTAPLEVYAPSAFHAKDATVLTVKAGDERGDIVIRADLSGMHSVSGVVRSAVDHHALNAGTVALVVDADKKFKRSAGINKDGTFHVAYVPSGTYTLTVSDAADQEPAKPKPGARAGLLNFAGMKTVRSFDEASQAVIVETNDTTGIAIELKQSEKVKKDMDLNQIFGGGGAPSKE